jgi:hypothetical protein
LALDRTLPEVIAISYRREDTAGDYWSNLRPTPSYIQPRSSVHGFRQYSVRSRFSTHISESLDRCDTLLVVIGPRWLGVAPDGSRRIDDPTDFVRREVAQALARNIRVIPLLIDRTEMPSGNSLPEDVKTLAFRNALRVDSDADFHHHINRLCSSLQSTPGSSTLTVSGFPPSLCNAKTAQPFPKRVESGGK